MSKYIIYEKKDGNLVQRDIELKSKKEASFNDVVSKEKLNEISSLIRGLFVELDKDDKTEIVDFTILSDVIPQPNHVIGLVSSKSKKTGFKLIQLFSQYPEVTYGLLMKKIVTLGVFQRLSEVNYISNPEFFERLKDSTISVPYLFESLDPVYVSKLKERNAYITAENFFIKKLKENILELTASTHTSSGIAMHICGNCSNAVCSKIKAYDWNVNVKNGENASKASRHIGYHDSISGAVELVKTDGSIAMQYVSHCDDYVPNETMASRKKRILSVENERLAKIRRINEMKELRKYRGYSRVVVTDSGVVIKTLDEKK